MRLWVQELLPIKRTQFHPGVVMYTLNPNSQETRQSDISLSLAWSTGWLPEQPELHRENLPLKSKEEEVEENGVGGGRRGEEESISQPSSLTFDSYIFLSSLLTLPCSPMEVVILLSCLGWEFQRPFLCILTSCKSLHQTPFTGIRSISNER